MTDMTYEDILFEKKDGVATITINRPDKMNAFRGQTVEEIIHAFNRAGWDKEVGVIVLTGAGDRAFCTGGDQSAHDGNYDGRGLIGLPVEELQSIIREVPKPVIARVQGYAIGGGNVLATLCDLTIASEKAVFGQWLFAPMIDDRTATDRASTSSRRTGRTPCRPAPPTGADTTTG